MKKICIILLVSFSFTQWYSINHEGGVRSYYITESLSSLEPAALVINMHGFGGNALGQATTAMINFAAENMIVVYPQGATNSFGYPSWNVGTYWDGNNYDDVDFISKMIDNIAEDFVIDLDRVYACGMSNGGYMAYRLACELSNKIAAFGSVTGNFMLDAINCEEHTREIPIIHFHGTADGVVDYYPPSFDQALTIEESISFWSNKNDLTQVNFWDLNNSVEIQEYSSLSSTVNFTHYKVSGGSHEWFGNNWGFNTSEELLNYFLQYRLSDFVYTNLLGDLNNDEAVNILDILLIIDLILESTFDENADINTDNYIDILDIVEIVQIILNN